MNQLERIGRWIAVFAMVFWTYRFASSPFNQTVIGGTFLHNPNLIFHEAGHIIFSPLGRFMTMLGGSLFQILVPIICAISFAYQYGNWFAAAVMTWWAGQNLVDVAMYIADARKLQLVLLGGHTGAEVEGHDWEYILGELRWLHLDMTLGRAAHVAGSVIMVAAIVWAVALIFRRPPELTYPSHG